MSGCELAKEKEGGWFYICFPCFFANRILPALWRGNRFWRFFLKELSAQCFSSLKISNVKAAHPPSWHIMLHTLQKIKPANKNHEKSPELPGFCGITLPLRKLPNPFTRSTSHFSGQYIDGFQPLKKFLRRCAKLPFFFRKRRRKFIRKCGPRMRSIAVVVGDAREYHGWMGTS